MAKSNDLRVRLFVFLFVLVGAQIVGVKFSSLLFSQAFPGYLVGGCVAELCDLFIRLRRRSKNSFRVYTYKALALLIATWLAMITFLLDMILREDGYIGSAGPLDSAILFSLIYAIIGLVPWSIVAVTLRGFEKLALRKLL